MKKQRVLIWTGGRPDADGCGNKADALLLLSDPAPLRRAAHIEYRWGDMRFTILASACALRTTYWGSEQVTWLHCKARTTAEIAAGQEIGLMAILIPARYVTCIKPGPTFRIMRSKRSDELGVFPPNQPAPAQALSLSEVERALVSLLASERN